MAHVLINKGDRFVCIKTYIMEDGSKMYKKGKSYTSEVDNCITDEEGDVNHIMGSSDVTLNEFTKHFYQIKN